MTRRIRTRDAVVVAGVAAVLVALPALRNGFTYDDVWIVERNAAVTSPSGLGQLLTATFWPPSGEGHGVLWRPVTLVAFAAQWVVGGGGPFLFHLVTAALSGVTAALLALVAALMFGPMVGLVAGVLFGVHPVHVEVTATVVGQAELWAAAGYLGALAAAWQASGAPGRDRLRWTLVMAAALAMGLGAKEHALTFPLALLPLWWVRARTAGQSVGAVARDQAWVAAAAVGVVAAYLVVRALVLRDIAGDAGGIATGLAPHDPWQRLRVMLPVTLRWLELLFVPWRLSADYSPRHLVPDAGPGVLHAAAALVWIGLAAGAWRVRRAAPAITVGAALFGLTVTIVSNVVVPLEVLLAERLLFLPSAGWAIAVAGALVAAGRGPRLRRAAIAAGTVMAVAFAGRSMVRATVWRSNETLFAQMLREAPASFRTHWALGAEAFARGDSVTGEREWREAIRLNPQHPQPIEDLGRLFARTGRWEEAVPLLEAVVRLDSGRVGSALALGTGYTRLGRSEDALALLRSMGSRHEGEAMFPALEAEALRREERFAEALDAARRAAARDSTQWQLWLLAAETAVLAGDCATAGAMEARARSVGGPPAEETIQRVLAAVANRKGSCN